MKKLFSLLTAALSAATITAAADSPKSGEQSPFSGLDMQTKIQMMKQFDKDGDGRLNAEERAAAKDAMKNKSADLEELKKKHVEEIMKKFDKDGDGKLDQSELSSFLDEQRKMFMEQRRRMGPRHMRLPPEVLAKFDKDGDGKLSSDERKAMFTQARERRAALIKKYDKDGDGILSDTERNELVKDPEVQSMMKRMLSRPMPPEPPRD